MDTRTREIFDFVNQKVLEKALDKNPYLVEVDCDKMCDFRDERFGRSFCTANRGQRRGLKCLVKRKRED